MVKSLGFYPHLLVMLTRRAVRRFVNSAGELLKRLGRKLVLSGTDNSPRWTVALLNQCHKVDAELHLGVRVYRGALYAAYLDEGKLVLRFNWLAQKHLLGSTWDFFSPTRDFVLLRAGNPVTLQSGDVLFALTGSDFGVLYLGEARSRLQFAGSPELPRMYTYF